MKTELFSQMTKARRASVGESGSALIATVMVCFVLTALLGLAFNLTHDVAKNSERSRLLEKATAFADGILETQFAQWRAICQNRSSTPLSSSDFADVKLPPIGDRGTVESSDGKTIYSMTPREYTVGSKTFKTEEIDYIVSNAKIVAVDELMRPLASATTPPPPAVSAGDNTFNYLATADVTIERRGAPLTAKVGRVFQKKQTSPWSYAIFYDMLLEINPGAAMDVKGMVHSNNYVYMGGAGSPLVFHDTVEAVSGVLAEVNPLDPRANRNSSGVSLVVPSLNGVAEQSPVGIERSLLNPNTPNQTSYHEIIDPPNPNFPDPLFADYRFHNEADLRIVLSGTDFATTNVAVYDKAGNPVNSTILNNVKAALTTGTANSIQDNREAALMQLTNLDVGKISQSLSSVLNGGVLYITDSRAVLPKKEAVAPVAAVKDKKGNIITPAVPGVPGNPKTIPAIRLVNGGTLPEKGLTIATNNPIYVQGDYNTGTTSSTAATLDSNKTQGGTPTLGAYTRKPAAIIGDAVSILSNAWKDSNSTASLSTRKASPTTVNAAIMTGIVPSNGKDYSGGVENFPRFLESWSGVRMTYYGSMVCLYNSKTAVSPWGASNVYDAPNRYWNFDENFRTNPPPGDFFVMTSYAKQRWFMR